MKRLLTLLILVATAVSTGCGADDDVQIVGANSGPGGNSATTDSGASNDATASDMSSQTDGGTSASDTGTSMMDATSGSEDAATGEDAGAPGPLVIYMAPDGDDARDGASPAAAIKSLGRAQELIAPVEGRDVDVRVALGTYYAQTVVWTETRPNNQIRFTRWPLDASGRPVFDGCTSANGSCPGGTWFRLNHSAGEETNLEFRYLRIENYGTAISLDGNRNSEGASNGSNRIYGCYFANIGNEFNTSLSPSTAAVRLVNSDDNDISNNHFVNVVNTTSGGLIHAIYVAHMSDRNTIRANRFKRSSGDPVRVRDFSNDNQIRDNRFIQVGTYAGYTDWYCDHDVREDCTKVGPECPSWGNEFRDNLLDGKFDCSPLGTFHYFQDDSTTGCAPPSATARRLRTSGNTQNTPPCTSE